MTLSEAIKIAEQKKYAPKLSSIIEYADRYVFGYSGFNGEIPDLSPLYVMKNNGEVGVFFPPDYDDDYFYSGKSIQIPENITQPREKKDEHTSENA